LGHPLHSWRLSCNILPILPILPRLLSHPCEQVVGNSSCPTRLSCSLGEPFRSPDAESAAGRPDRRAEQRREALSRAVRAQSRRPSRNQRAAAVKGTPLALRGTGTDSSAPQRLPETRIVVAQVLEALGKHIRLVRRAETRSKPLCAAWRRSTAVSGWPE
jgi:hypothetical protein